MLVDAVNNRNTPGATESTVLGPFHVGGAPTRELGADIALTGDARGAWYAALCEAWTGAHCPAR